MVLAAAAHAGAWTKETGQVYAKAGVDLYKAFEFVQPGSSSAVPGAISGGEYFAHQYGVYAEAGVIPGYKGQLSVSAPLLFGVANIPGDDDSGTVPIRATTGRLGDLNVAAQVALHPKWPLAAALQLKIPMYANGTVGADYPTWRELFPKPGDGQVDWTTWLYAGAAPIPKSFVEGSLGYRHRTEQFVGWDTSTTFVDAALFGAKGGYSLGRVLPIVGVDGVVSLADDLYSREYLSVSASALIDLADGVALEPRLATELWANNSSRGLAGGVGMSYRR